LGGFKEHFEKFSECFAGNVYWESVECETYDGEGQKTGNHPCWSFPQVADSFT